LAKHGTEEEGTRKSTADSRCKLTAHKRLYINYWYEVTAFRSDVQKECNPATSGFDPTTCTAFYATQFPAFWRKKKSNVLSCSFSRALRVDTRDWVLIGGAIRCIEDAQEARSLIEVAQEARSRSGTPCQQRPTHGVGSPRRGPLLGGVSRTRDRSHGLFFKSAHFNLLRDVIGHFYGPPGIFLCLFFMDSPARRGAGELAFSWRVGFRNYLGRPRGAARRNPRT
jgi:hypothetical protein